MPTLGAALDFAKLEGRNFRAHQLGAAPSSPVTGQLYYDTVANALYYYNGSAWIAAGAGAGPADATTSSKGIVQLAGDLAGTAASPQIAAGVITDSDVNAANKDGAVGTPSLRTLGSGATQAAPGNRTLDADPAPIASLNLNNQRIISLADPTAAQDGATKNYVDNVATGLDAKASVKAASTANIALSAPGATIDGVTMTANDRFLAKDQSTPSQNGIYIWTGAASPATRASDMNVWAEVPSAYTWVEQGTVNADSGWVCTADQGGTIDSTSMTWTQFSGAGAVVAGGGLTKTANTLDVGAGAGITVNADTIQVANNGITNAMLADAAVNLASLDVTGTLPVTNGGTGGITPVGARTALGAMGRYGAIGPPSTGTTWLITQATHLLNADQYLLVQVADLTSKLVELVDIAISTTGAVTITWGASVTANTKYVTIVG